MRSEFTSSANQRPIFMVDDDELDRIVFTRLVRDAKIERPARVFARGELMIDALIEVLRGAPAPLVCFLDVRMPGMSGFDVLRWLRCQQSLDDIPAVMLSSLEDTQVLNEARHLGAECYLAKFPTAAQLKEIVEEAERVAAASVGHAFKLSCNLLVATPQTTSC